MIIKASPQEPFDFYWRIERDTQQTSAIIDILSPIFETANGLEPSFFYVEGDPFELLDANQITLLFAVVKLCSDHLFAIETRKAKMQMDFMRSGATPGAVAEAMTAIVQNPQTRAALGVAASTFLDRWVRPGDASTPFPPYNLCVGAVIGDAADKEKVQWLVRTPAKVRFIRVEECARPCEWSRYAIGSDMAPGKIDPENDEIEMVETFEQRIEWAYARDIRSKAFNAFTFRQASEAGVPLYMTRNPAERIRQLPAFNPVYIPTIQRIMKRTEATTVDPAQQHVESVDAEYRGGIGSQSHASAELAGLDYRPAIEGATTGIDFGSNVKTIDHVPADDEIAPINHGKTEFVAWATAEEIGLGDKDNEMFVDSSYPDEIPAGKKTFNQMREAFDESKLSEEQFKQEYLNTPAIPLPGEQPYERKTITDPGSFPKCPYCGSTEHRPINCPINPVHGALK